ncbi:MAG: sulfite oxidase heme-binding subunit YedZ [Thermoanaerobaculia bacterium]
MNSKPKGAGRRSWLKPAVFLGSLTPLGAILLRAARGDLGANPIAQALNQLGLMALVFLIASLACTPVREILGWTWAVGLRRMLGLFAFFYALLHASTYAGLDQLLDLRALFSDVTKRKFIFVGFAAFVLLIPLAVTSTANAVRRLGFVRWKRLHRLAYLAGGLAAVHFIWRVKKDLTEPAIYAALLAILLLSRVFIVARERARRPKCRPSAISRPGVAPSA